MYLKYRMTQKENKCLYQCVLQFCPHNLQECIVRGYWKKTNHSPPASSCHFFVSHPFSSSSKLFPKELSVGGDSSPSYKQVVLLPPSLSHPPAPLLWIKSPVLKFEKIKWPCSAHKNTHLRWLLQNSCCCAPPQRINRLSAPSKRWGLTYRGISGLQYNNCIFY